MMFFRLLPVLAVAVALSATVVVATSSPYCVATTSDEASLLACYGIGDSSTCEGTAGCTWVEPAFYPDFPRIKAGGVRSSEVDIEIRVQDIPSFGIAISCDAYLWGGQPDNYPDRWELYHTDPFLERYRSNLVGSDRIVFPSPDTTVVLTVNTDRILTTATAIVCTFEDFLEFLEDPPGSGTFIPNPDFHKRIAGNPLFPTNTEPVQAIDIGNQHALPGWPFYHLIDPATFVESDAGDTLACVPSVPRTEIMPDGEVFAYVDSLPGWLSYDDSTRTFSGTPDVLDVEEFLIQFACSDHFGATVTDSWLVKVWGLGFLPGYPRIAPGTLLETSYDLEVAFVPGVHSLDDTGWTCQAFTDGQIPQWTQDPVIGPYPNIPSVDAVRALMPGTGQVQVRRLDVAHTGLSIDQFDVYCAFTPDVDWWTGPYPVMSNKVEAVFGAAGGGTSGVLTGFVPGYPRLRSGTLSKHSVLIDLLVYKDTRALQPQIACHAIPRGTPYAVDGFGVPAVLHGKFGTEFVPGKLLNGRITTGTVDISTTDIYCTYNDFDTGLWVISSPVVPTLGFSPGYPRIKANSLVWDTVKIEIRFENETISNNEFSVCHAFPENVDVTWDEHGNPTPSSIAEYSIPFEVGVTRDLLLYTAQYNMTDLKILCEWQDSEDVWVQADPIFPSLGYLPGYPHVIPEEFVSKTTVRIEIKFGEHTDMPWNSTFPCYAFNRDDEPTWIPDDDYRQFLPCLPTDCYHAQPPLPVPEAVATQYYTWDGTRDSVFEVELDTAPASPVSTKVMCAYLDVDRKWVLSDFTLPNNGPTKEIDIPDQTGYEETPFAFIVPETSFNDLDGEPLTYSAVLLDTDDTALALPSWLSFDPATRLFSGTPFFDDVGVYRIQVKVVDEPGASATSSFRLEVIDNIAPLTTLTALAVDPESSTGPWTAILRFTEPVTGVVPNALLTNALYVEGSLVAMNDNQEYRFDFEFETGVSDPVADIVVTASTGAAFDRAGNPSVAAPSNVQLERLHLPLAAPSSLNVLSSDPIQLEAGSNNPSGVLFQYSRDDGQNFSTLVGSNFTLDGELGSMLEEDRIVITDRIPEYAIHIRTRLQRDPAAPVEFTGQTFIPSILGQRLIYDVNEVLEIPGWTPNIQRVMSNMTFTLLPGGNDPGLSWGRNYQYSPDKVVWYDLPTDQLRFDGVVPSFQVQHQLNFTHYSREVTYYFRAVAPSFRDGVVLRRDFLVNPCHPWCSICHGFSNLECTLCNTGFFLFEGLACVQPSACGRGQEANVAEAICKDLPRVLFSTVLVNKPPPTDSIGLTRPQVIDGQQQLLEVTMEENTQTAAVIFVSMSRKPIDETSIDIQWNEVREGSVRVSEGVAISSRTLMTAFPTAQFYTSKDWNVPQPVQLLPFNTEVYEGHRTVYLNFSMNSPSFPVDDLFTLDVGIPAVIQVNIREDDPMILPIVGITTDRKVWLHESVSQTLFYTLPRAPTSDVVLMITKTIEGTLVNGELAEGVWSTDNATVSVVDFLTFTPSDWNSPHEVVVTAEDDDVFTDFQRDYLRLSYHFVASDPFYSLAFILPTDIVVSEDDAGCPRQYQCLNKGECITATLPLPNSFDALDRPFTFGGRCDCFTGYGGKDCSAFVFEFVRVDFLMQAAVLTELDVDFKDGRTWRRLANVLEVCDQSVYVVNLQGASCDPGDVFDAVPTVTEIRARQAAGYYDDFGNPVVGVEDPTSDSETTEEAIGPDPYATCSALGGGGGTGGGDLESSECVAITVDLMAADGTGDAEAAENVRLRFQRLQLQWERAGAAAATVTGLDYVAYMQFNAEQFVQEVLRTPLPPVDNSLKLRDYTLIAAVAFLCAAFLAWLCYRLYIPYKAWRDEQKRLNTKFAPQEDNPDAILRPETLMTVHKDKIKEVMRRTRQREREAIEVGKAADEVAPGQVPQVNPFIQLDMDREAELEEEDRNRLLFGSPTASLPGTPEAKALDGHTPRTPTGRRQLGNGSVAPSPRAEALRPYRSTSRATLSRPGGVAGTPRSSAGTPRHDNGSPGSRPGTSESRLGASARLGAPASKQDVTVVIDHGDDEAGSGPSGFSSPLADPRPASSSGSAGRASAGGDGHLTERSHDSSGRPLVARPKTLVVMEESTSTGLFHDSPRVVSPATVGSRTAPAGGGARGQAGAGFDTRGAGGSGDAGGEESAMAILAQRTRPLKPRPLKDQVRRALRINQKVRLGILKDGEEPPARDHYKLPK